MDRFIEYRQDFYIHCIRSLKSNMDRFIGPRSTYNMQIKSSLKSNMDRFIESSILVIFQAVKV